MAKRTTHFLTGGRIACHSGMGGASGWEHTRDREQVTCRRCLATLHGHPSLDERQEEVDRLKRKVEYLEMRLGKVLERDRKGIEQGIEWGHEHELVMCKLMGMDVQDAYDAGFKNFQECFYAFLRHHCRSLGVPEPACLSEQDWGDPSDYEYCPHCRGSFSFRELSKDWVCPWCKKDVRTHDRRA